jgi:hypothetical protein
VAYSGCSGRASICRGEKSRKKEEKKAKATPRGDGDSQHPTARKLTELRGLSARLEREKSGKKRGQWGLAPWRIQTCRSIRGTGGPKKGARCRGTSTSHIKMGPRYLALLLRRRMPLKKWCASANVRQWLGHACPFFSCAILRQLEWGRWPLGERQDFWERAAQRACDSSVGQRDAFSVGI